MARCVALQLIFDSFALLLNLLLRIVQAIQGIVLLPLGGLSLLEGLLGLLHVASRTAEIAGRLILLHSAQSLRHFVGLLTQFVLLAGQLLELRAALARIRDAGGVRGLLLQPLLGIG